MIGKFIVAFIGLTGIAVLANSQQREISAWQDTSFIINTNTPPGNVIPAGIMYRYAHFLKGRIFFRAGNVTEAKMNYNRLFDEMAFISHTGDTLFLSEAFTVKFICIDRDTFYYDNGYILAATNNPAVKLGITQGFVSREEWKLINRVPVNAPVIASNFNPGSVSEEGAYRIDMIRQNIVSTVTSYYFGDRYNHFVIATKKNIIELFPKYTGRIRAFCKKNHIDFDRKTDLENLTAFLTNNCH